MRSSSIRISRFKRVHELSRNINNRLNGRVKTSRSLFLLFSFFRTKCSNFFRNSSEIKRALVCRWWFVPKLLNIYLLHDGIRKFSKNIGENCIVMISKLFFIEVRNYWQFNLLLGEPRRMQEQLGSSWIEIFVWWIGESSTAVPYTCGRLCLNGNAKSRRPKRIDAAMLW